MTRKIDMMVAKEVFGVDIKVIDESGWETVYLDEKTGRSIPRYSTDIAEAWNVLGMFKGRHWRIESMSDGFRVSLPMPRIKIVVLANTYEDIPGAICLSSLKAKGVSQQLIDEALKQ